VTKENFNLQTILKINEIEKMMKKLVAEKKPEKTYPEIK
jgi:hypothetical protein